MNETITNYVCEVHVAGKPWITWPDGSTPTSEEGIARASYATACSSRHTENTHFRLVKRTAVITDEVLEEDSHYDHRHRSAECAP